MLARMLRPHEHQHAMNDGRDGRSPGHEGRRFGQNDQDGQGWDHGRRFGQNDQDGQGFGHRHHFDQDGRGPGMHNLSGSSTDTNQDSQALSLHSQSSLLVLVFARRPLIVSPPRNGRQKTEAAGTRSCGFRMVRPWNAARDASCASPRFDHWAPRGRRQLISAMLIAFDGRSGREPHSAHEPS